MPKLSKESTQATDHGPVVEWSQDMDGYAVNIVQFKNDIDHTPLFKGLPDDRCQCPHWGYVTQGSVTFSYEDRDETYSAGDAFYAPPGHVPIGNEPGTEYVQFSPCDELKKTEEAIMANMGALQG